ncbi:MAG: SDR family oxidoreductase [Acidimicrobiia bacterium]|nr:SDR family oxidoreductase [Acidimicrobiia bacterium]
MDLRDRVALVTGGASGIGAATVSLLLAMGSKVASLDLQPSPDADLSLDVDVADEAQMTDAVRRVQEDLGLLKLVVLNAGVGSFSPIRSMTVEEWDRVHRVNVRAALIGLRECAEAMSDGGAIVAVTSISGFTVERGLAAYSTSKAALAQLVRVAARELGPRITVNGVAPGATDTPLFSSTAELPGFQDRAARRAALGRLGRPIDIAAAIVSLLSLDWVTGQVLVADGGVSLYSPIDPMEALES